MNNLTRRLIDCVGHAAETANEQALERARLCWLDWLGVTLAGAAEPQVTLLATATAAPGQKAQRLIGRTEALAPLDAVLVNGFAGHILDYDDGLGTMMGHPSVAIMPALWSLALGEGIGGKRLLRATVAGIEAAGRIGLMLNPGHYNRGFHATGTIGAMAGAIGSAYLLGLDPAKSMAACGLAGTRAAGLKASFGTDGKPLHAAWAAVNAATAARWAMAGLTGADDILGQSQGFGATLSPDFQPEAGLNPHLALQILQVNFKYHAACAITHPAIDLALDLACQPGFELTRIESINLTVAHDANDICNIAEPDTGLALKFSLRGTCAMALLGIDTASPGSFSDALAENPELVALRNRITVGFDPGFKLGQTRIELRFNDGTVQMREAMLDEPEADSRLLTDRLSAKFMALASKVIGATNSAALRDELLNGAPSPDLLRLAPLTAPTKDQIAHE